MSYTSTQQNASTTSVYSAQQMAHNAAVRLQNQTKLDNAAQSAAFWALRSGGKAEAATQMKIPISTQTFYTRQGTYVVEGTGKSAARIAAEKRSEEIQQAKLAAAAHHAYMISVSENSKNMPSSDAQSQYNNIVSNNNVNPASLFPSQPVNSNGNSQNSSVSGGINVNANYNYATQMNDFQNQHHNSQVNHGQAPQSYYTAGKSSIPFENEVKTSLLGGDIQHQESEINTNVGYLPEINDPQDTIGSATGYAGAGIALAGIGALLLMGKMK